MVVGRFNIKERGIFMENINVNRGENEMMESENKRDIKRTLKTIYFLIAI